MTTIIYPNLFKNKEYNYELDKQHIIENNGKRKFLLSASLDFYKYNRRTFGLLETINDKIMFLLYECTSTSYEHPNFLDMGGEFQNLSTEAKKNLIHGAYLAKQVMSDEFKIQNMLRKINKILKKYLNVTLELPNNFFCSVLNTTCLHTIKSIDKECNIIMNFIHSTYASEEEGLADFILSPDIKIAYKGSHNEDDFAIEYPEDVEYIDIYSLSMFYFLTKRRELFPNNDLFDFYGSAGYTINIYTNYYRFGEELIKHIENKTNSYYKWQKQLDELTKEIPELINKLEESYCNNDGFFDDSLNMWGYFKKHRKEKYEDSTRN